MTIAAYRIARETIQYQASDLSGAGAASGGGRWNAIEIPMVYASLSRALAALETLVHFAQPGDMPLPFDHYLVAIPIPLPAWEKREVFDPAEHGGWDAIPASKTAVAWSSEWARSKRSLIAVVPSVIVPEERNVLINPTHADARALKANVMRKWLYDPRLSRSRN